MGWAADRWRANSAARLAPLLAAAESALALGKPFAPELVTQLCDFATDANEFLEWRWQAMRVIGAAASSTRVVAICPTVSAVAERRIWGMASLPEAIQAIVRSVPMRELSADHAVALAKAILRDGLRPPPRTVQASWRRLRDRTAVLRPRALWVAVILIIGASGYWVGRIHGGSLPDGVRSLRGRIESVQGCPDRFVVFSYDAAGERYQICVPWGVLRGRD